MPALAFERVSSAKQEHGYFLEIQHENADRYAQMNNLHIVHSFQIAESSWKHGKRKAFQQMLTTASEYNIHNLIFRCVDRIGRNYHDLAKVMDLIEQEGYIIHFFEGAGDRIHKGSTYAEKMIIGVKMAFAKQHSDKISEYTEARLQIQQTVTQARV